MISLSSSEQIESILRSNLIIQSELSAEQVLNSLSIHGEDLDKLFDEQVYVSIDRTDALLLFELQSRQSDSDVSNSDDDSILTYRSFSLRCIVYGNDSTNVSTKIISRFRTSEVIETLQSQGIYLEQISDADILNEYKNNTMWLRNDFTLDISCKFTISKNSTGQSIDSAKVDKIIIL